jgi:3',5'-cyclic AMP phosphodiesterase CpdA
MKLIHLSDLHLTEARQPLFGSCPMERLDRAVESILHEHADAQFCILTGDLADDGSESAYGDLAKVLTRLPMPVYPMMGNHDEREAIRRQFPHLGVDASGFVQTVVDTAAGRFLFLDTLDSGFSWGRYCESRQAWLRKHLAESGNQPVWLAMHHPPLSLGIPSMDQYALRDHCVFWSIVEPYRHRIRHIFLGHLHRSIGGSWNGIPFSCVRSPNHQVALDLVTTDKVPGCHEAPGYAVILIGESSVVIHQHEFLPIGERFWI